MADIPAKFVHHFIYKSKKHVQYVMPNVGVLDDMDFDYAENDTKSTFSEAGNLTEEIDDGASKADNTGQKTRQRAYLHKLMRYYTHIRNTAVDQNGKSFNKSNLTFVKWSNDGFTTDELPQGELVDTLCLAWLTPTFELLLICNNGVSDRSAALASAKNIVDWCRKNEQRLFVSNGAIF